MNTTVMYDKATSVGGVANVAGRLDILPGAVLYMDAGLNASLPAMSPMMLQLKIHEKRTNEFDVSSL